jgi:hypothetical protein
MRIQQERTSTESQDTQDSTIQFLIFVEIQKRGTSFRVRLSFNFVGALSTKTLACRPGLANPLQLGVSCADARATFPHELWTDCISNRILA